MENIKKVVSLKKNAEKTAFVGNKEDMVPFAWRQPLQLNDHKKMSKVFKTMQKEETERALLMPAHTDN